MPSLLLGHGHVPREGDAVLGLYPLTDEVRTEQAQEPQRVAQLRAMIEAKITELGVSGPQAMGQVIGAVKQQAGNAADGALIARLVKETLTK